MQTDYLALEIVNGKASFKYDLGSGAALITSDADVSDNKWHEVIAERFVSLLLLVVKLFQYICLQLFTYLFI